MPLFMTLVVFISTKSLCFHYRSLYNYLNFYEIQVALNILINRYSLRYVKFVLIMFEGKICGGEMGI